MHLDDGDALPFVIVPTHYNYPFISTLVDCYSDEKHFLLVSFSGLFVLEWSG